MKNPGWVLRACSDALVVANIEQIMANASGCGFCPKICEKVRSEVIPKIGRPGAFLKEFPRDDIIDAEADGEAEGTKNAKTTEDKLSDMKKGMGSEAGAIIVQFLHDLKAGGYKTGINGLALEHDPCGVLVSTEAPEKDSTYFALIKDVQKILRVLDEENVLGHSLQSGGVPKTSLRALIQRISNTGDDQDEAAAQRERSQLWEKTRAHLKLRIRFVPRKGKGNLPDDYLNKGKAWPNFDEATVKFNEKHRTFFISFSELLC